MFRRNSKRCSSESHPKYMLKRTHETMMIEGVQRLEERFKVELESKEKTFQMFWEGEKK